MPPAIAPPPAAASPAPDVAPEPSAIPVFPNSPSNPLPPATTLPSNASLSVAFPIMEPTRDVPVSGFTPNNPFPILTPPFAIPINSLATLLSTIADKTEDNPADSPPGNSFPALENMPLNPCHSLPDTVSKSNPSEKPFANAAPKLTPSSEISLIFIPNNVIIPVLNPDPIPLPIFCANFSFPVPFHHSKNGSAINSSQAIFTFPKKFASFHFFVFVSLSNFLCIWSTFVSTQSISSSSALSIIGICSVNHSAKLLI